MATFLPNVTDVFAGVSDFDPDFNRIERMLKIRENAYQQGAKRVKSLYESVFNSQMLRDQNIKTRDAYLKTISNTLNALSATDLSLPQNQEMATNLFNPILTDANLTKDIAYTRNLYSEMSKAEKLRTSTDNATRNQYWSPGVKALQYQAEEFKNADANTALGMSAPRYVPKIDVRTLAEEAYKKAGISVKEDQINGGYIWTKKNGTSVFPISQSFVNSLFSNDAGIQDMIRTQAYVERKDFIKTNATKYGGEEQAEAMYIRNIFNAVGKDISKQTQADDQELRELRAKKDAWDKKITGVGIIPGSDEHKQYLADMEKLELAEQTVNNNKNSLPSLKTIDFNNIDELRQQADNLVSFSNLTLLTNNIARELAFKDAELTVKADPIYLTELRSKLSLRNQQIMESIRQANRIEMLEKEIKAGKYKKKEEDDETPDDGTISDQFNNNPFVNTPTSSSNQTSLFDFNTIGTIGSSSNTSSSTNEDGVIKAKSSSSSTENEENSTENEETSTETNYEVEFGD